MKVKFKEWDCIAKFGKYPSTNQNYIQLIDSEDGFPVATASINMPGLDLLPNEVIIKDYSENEGMFDTLVNAGIIKKTNKGAQLTYGIAPIAEIIKRSE
jgi:hypothetical protein